MIKWEKSLMLPLAYIEFTLFWSDHHKQFYTVNKSSNFCLISKLNLKNNVEKIKRNYTL